MTGSDDIIAELEIRAADTTLIENNLYRRALAALVAERAETARLRDLSETLGGHVDRLGTDNICLTQDLADERALSDTLAAALEASETIADIQAALTAWRVARGGQQ